jgi:hypothetical protein
VPDTEQNEERRRPERPNTRRIVEAAGGRYSPNSSASSGMEDERDFVESALSYATFEIREDNQAAHTDKLANNRYEINIYRQWLDQEGMTAQQVVMHEGTHVGVDLSYNNDMPFWNVNFPQGDGAVVGESVRRQQDVILANLEQVGKRGRARRGEGVGSARSCTSTSRKRVNYARVNPLAEYDTVINELSEKLNKDLGRKEREATRTYKYLQKAREAKRDLRISGEGEHRSVAREPVGPFHAMQEALPNPQQIANSVYNTLPDWMRNQNQNQGRNR